MTRIWAALIGAAGALALTCGATAWAAAAGSEPGLFHEVAHKHVHMNGHSLLGAGLKHDGKHGLGKLGGRDVTADVKGGKVTAMSAGDLPVKHFKSDKKMALGGGGFMPVAFNPLLTPAQYDQVYYAYCFDDGVTLTCYWYPASDVDPTAYDYLPYDPTY
jgi:hypothetical protein